MWKFAAHCVALGVVLSLAACLPTIPGTIPPEPSPALTFESTPSAQPTSPGPAPRSTATLGLTFTPIPTLTVAASLPVATTSTGSGATSFPTPPDATATPGETLSLDKLPPGTVYKSVRIQNQSHSQMDVSLHCTTIHGLHTVLEYNNVRNLTTQAPEGDYIYVLYVGGRQMSGSFSLLHVPAVTITVYADRVAIH
jgi:hypothetical protein